MGLFLLHRDTGSSCLKGAIFRRRLPSDAGGTVTAGEWRGGFVHRVSGAGFWPRKGGVSGQEGLCRFNGRILLVSSFLHGTAVVGAEDFPSLLGLQHRTCEAPYTAFRGQPSGAGQFVQTFPAPFLLERHWVPPLRRARWLAPSPRPRGAGCAGAAHSARHATSCTPGARAGLRVRPQSTIAW
jgi:hypothetical protein